MTIYPEPPPMEVRITLALGNTLLRPYYDGFVRRLGLRGDEWVLDYGSGAGLEAQHIAARLLPGCGRLTCLDVSRVWSRVASGRLRRDPHVECLQGTLDQCKLPSGCYDLVLVHYVLHDIDPAEWPGIITHLQRTLRRGGRLVIREPMANAPRLPEQLAVLWPAHGLRVLRGRVTRLPLLGLRFDAELAKA